MVAKFTVFQDPEDVVPANAAPASTLLNILQPKSSSLLLAAAAADLVFNPDKENFDPLTGVRITGVNAKKRKSPALTPKSLPPLSIKNKSEPALAAAAAAPSTKKPRASSVSVQRPGLKRRSSEKKPPIRPSPKRLCTMPDIREDLEASPEKRRTQQLIDERCYDFTVSPLADVTTMFDVVCSLEDAPSSTEQYNWTLGMNNASDPIFGDYPLAGPTRSATLPKMMTVGLTTPERKKLTAEFTFSSPSSTAERVKLSRTVSSPPDINMSSVTASVV